LACLARASYILSRNEDRFTMRSVIHFIQRHFYHTCWIRESLVQTSLQINTKDEVLCPDCGELSELVLLLGSISKTWVRNGLYAILCSTGGGIKFY